MIAPNFSEGVGFGDTVTKNAYLRALTFQSKDLYHLL